MKRLALLAAPAAALIAVVPVVSTLEQPAVAAKKDPAAGPLLFGHRGASAYRPEHTLAAYDVAVRLGADVIEPDVVSTKDGVLVARHENEIGGTTDVADQPEFAGRRTTKVIDGVSTTGWFTEDFTYAELRTLRTTERLPQVRQESTAFEGRSRIPTLQEVLEYAAAASKRHGRTIGVAPETKHPTYFDEIGLSLEEPLLRVLREEKLDRKDSPVYVQSFEEANLRDLRERLGARVTLVQLTSAGSTSRPYDHVAAGDPQTYAQMTTPAGLAEIATYADVIGPEKSQVLPRDASGRTGTPSALVRNAHASGLQVVPYTNRAENQFLPVQHRRGTDPTAYGDVLAELRDLFAAGVDGVFTDNPDAGLAAREDLLGHRESVAHPAADAG